MLPEKFFRLDVSPHIILSLWGAKVILFGDLLKEQEQVIMHFIILNNVMNHVSDSRYGEYNFIRNH
jgi:hypothetical protein